VRGKRKKAGKGTAKAVNTKYLEAEMSSWGEEKERKKLPRQSKG